jgi:hypothetical protein
MKRIALIIVLAAILGCAKHKDFPSPLDVKAPPTPTNFTVTMDSLGTYYLDWEVVDSSSVAYYQIYTFDAFAGLSAFDTTSVSSYQASFGLFKIVGIVWGVSAVTVDNIESVIVYGSAPGS